MTTSYKRFLQQLERERLFREGDREADIMLVGRYDGDDRPLYIVPYPLSEAEWIARVEREQAERARYRVADDLIESIGVDPWPGTQRVEVTRPQAEASQPPVEDLESPLAGTFLAKPPKQPRQGKPRSLSSVAVEIWPRG